MDNGCLDCEDYMERIAELEADLEDAEESLAKQEREHDDYVARLVDEHEDEIERLSRDLEDMEYELEDVRAEADEAYSEGYAEAKSDLEEKYAAQTKLDNALAEELWLKMQLHADKELPELSKHMIGDVHDVDDFARKVFETFERLVATAKSHRDTEEKASDKKARAEEELSVAIKRAYERNRAVTVESINEEVAKQHVHRDRSGAVIVFRRDGGQDVE